MYSATQDGTLQSENKVDFIDEQIQNVFDDYEDNMPSSTPKNQDLGI